MSYKIWGPTLRFLETLLHLPKMVMTNTLLLKMTIKIVELPIENGGSFHSLLYVYQRVDVSHLCNLCTFTYKYGGFHKWSTQNGWFIRENLLLTWMIWGLPLFQENPIYVQRDWIFHTDCGKITSPDSVQVFRWLTLSISTTIPKKYCAFRGTGSIAFS